MNNSDQGNDLLALTTEMLLHMSLTIPLRLATCLS